MMGDMIKRNYICRKCGAMRRGFAADVYKEVKSPACCGDSMQQLSSEQTQAAHRLERVARIEWLIAGGTVTTAARGRRRWRPTTSAD